MEPARYHSVPAPQLLLNPEALDLTFQPRVPASASQPGSLLAQFLDRRGCRVFEALGAFWAPYHGPFYSSIPNQVTIGREPREIQEMLRQHGVRCVRFPSAAGHGIPLGLYVCRPREYGLARLSSGFRRHVIRGLEICKIRRVEPAELLREGLPVNLDTMQRQQRYDPEFGDPARWKRFVQAVRQSPGIAVTGAYIGGRLSAYKVTCQEDGWLHMLYKMSRSHDRAWPIGHALEYAVLSEAASNPGIELAESAFRSPVPSTDEGLDSYKRHIGYTVEPRHLAICFHPWIAPLLASPLALAIAKAASICCAKSSRLEFAVRALEAARSTLRKDRPGRGPICAR